MSISTPILAPADGRLGLLPTEPVWPLSVAKYHDMIRAGILTEDDPVELLEGVLVIKRPKNPPHRLATGLIREALEGVLPSGWYVDSQEPITTLDSEPEPDVTVVRGTTEDYLDRHPGPADLALVVEVADATLSRDRNAKKRAYARAGLAVYWIVNLVDNQIEVYTNPSGSTETPTYGQQQNYGIEGQVPVVVDGREVCQLAVRGLLP